MTYIPDDRLLTQYLLRSLPEEQAQRLDELSIADDDFASRLSSAEHDLVDSYVRGQLTAEEAARFKSAYLSSPKHREKVRFAEAFLSFQERVATRPTVIRTAALQTETRASAWARFLSHWFGTSRSAGGWFAPQWGLAAAALLLLVASAYLLNTNRELRQRISRSESDRTALVQREKDVQSQLAIKTAASGTNPAAEPQANAQRSFDRLKVAAFVLVPSLRGAGSLPTVSWAESTDLVVLKLELETADFSTYRVAIEDSATQKILWQSGDLKPQSESGKQVLSFGFRPRLLKSANYLVRLNGVGANGPELVTSYPFRGVVK